MKVLELFIQLQELDRDIAQLKQSKQHLPNLLKRKKNEVQREIKKLAALEDKIKHNRVRIMDQESLLSSYDAKIEKKKEQLNMIKTNREYTTILQEIENYKKEKNDEENAIIVLMEENEKEGKIRIEQQSIIKEYQKRYLEFEQEVKEDLDEIDKEFQKLQKERAKQYEEIEKLDPSTLKIYEKLLTKDPKNAIVAVEEGACGYCNIQLRPNEMASLISSKIVYCKECSRLLHLPNKPSRL